MSRAQAIIVGGGIAAIPAFDATDESQGRGVIVTSDEPPAVGHANFGMDATRGVWVQSLLTEAQLAANERRAVLIGRDLQGLAALFTGNATQQVIIGFQAGHTTGSVPGSGIAIGAGSRTDGNAVVIGASCVVDCSAGTDRPVIINNTNCTNTAITSLVCIGGGSTACTIARGVVISGTVSTNGGVTFNDALCIQGTVQNGASICLGAAGPAGGPLTNGSDNVAIGSSGTQAGGTSGGTAYNQCIAIGQGAVATGSGATSNGNAIALGQSASATGSSTTAAVAIGRSATAAAGQAVIGSTGFPLDFRVVSAAAGVTFQVDASAAADDVRMLVWDVTAAALKRVSRGAIDSGGLGFRVLRIPN